MHSFALVGVLRSGLWDICDLRRPSQNIDQEFWEWVDRTQRYDPPLSLPPSLPPCPSSSSFMCCCCCRHADLLATDISAELCIKYIDRFLMFYIATAERLQRTSAWMEKLEGGVFLLYCIGRLVYPESSR